MTSFISKSELELEELTEMLKEYTEKEYVGVTKLFELLKNLESAREKVYESLIHLLYKIFYELIRDYNLQHNASISEWGIGIKRQETDVRLQMVGIGCSDNVRFYNQYELVLLVKKLWFSDIGYYDKDDFKEKPLSGKREINVLRIEIENFLQQRIKEYGLDVNVRVYFFDFI
jgi:hypothetical protein